VAGNTAYEIAGIAAYNTSAYYMAATGGSGNGNALYWWTGTAAVGPAKASDYGTGSTTYPWGNTRCVCLTGGWRGKAAAAHRTAAWQLRVGSTVVTTGRLRCRPNELLE
jgi:hypothetical protein